MVGVRFYLEYGSKNHKKANKDTGNIIAVAVDTLNQGMYYSAISALYNHPNSQVASTNIHYNFIRKQTKRISEAKARVIHPNLFAYIDACE